MALLLCVLPAGLLAQIPGPKTGGSANLRVRAHIPLGRYGDVTDVEIEQDLSRPYVYVSRRFDLAGFVILDVGDLEEPSVVYDWRIRDPELHQGGGSDGKYFKRRGRYYYVQAFEFRQGSADSDLGAVVFDVTGLPDTSQVREVGRIRTAGMSGAGSGGFHNVFAYRHSSGRALLFATMIAGTYATMFDLDAFLAEGAQSAVIGRVPVPDDEGRYHDFFVGYDPAARADKFYGGAQPGGYFVFDVTTPEEPKLLTSVTVPGKPVTSSFGRGHSATPSPDGRYLITETEYQYAPLRVFDLAPGLRGEVQSITQPIGAWTADWRALSHNHEVRWPYVFVAAYEDGLQIFNMMDPTQPFTVGRHYTCECPHAAGRTVLQTEVEIRRGAGAVLNGAWGVDVRNADGLIVVSDKVTGFWAFTLDGFDGWHGHQWGMPNVSSVQDWDAGPDGSSPPQS